MKFLSYILVAAISFGAAFLLISKPDSEPAMVVLEDTDDSANLEPTPYDSYYNKLTDFQKKIYNMILPAIEKHSKEITLENVNISDFKKNCPTVMLAIQYDRPDLFWYTGGARYTMRQEPFKEYGTVVFTPYNYSFAGSFFNYNKKQQQLTEAVKEVASLAKKHGSTDYERALFVHDYLIKNAIYDHDALKDAKT